MAEKTMTELYNEDSQNFISAAEELGIPNTQLLFPAGLANLKAARLAAVEKWYDTVFGIVIGKEFYLAIIAEMRAANKLQTNPEEPKSRAGILFDGDEDIPTDDDKRRSREASDKLIATSGPVNRKRLEIARRDLDAIMLLENRGISTPTQTIEREECERILGIRSGSTEFDEKVFVYRNLAGRGEIVDWAKTKAKRAENKAKNAAARGRNG